MLRNIIMNIQTLVRWSLMLGALLISWRVEAGGTWTPLVHSAPGGALYLSWRVTDGADQRDGYGRLYSAFESALIREAIDGVAETLLDDEPISASSGKKIHRIVARRTAAAAR